MSLRFHTHGKKKCGHGCSVVEVSLL